MTHILIIVIIGCIVLIALSAPAPTADTASLKLMRTTGITLLVGILCVLFKSLLTERCPRCKARNAFANHTMTLTVNGRTFRKEWRQCKVCGFEKDVRQH